MSAPSKLGNRGERNRSKYRPGDVGNTLKGSGSTQQKSSAGRHQYGAQATRKIVRRMPPPVNLPSLKSESSRLGVDSALVTPEHSGCIQSGQGAETEFGQSSFFSSYEQTGLLAQKSVVGDGQTSTAGYGHYIKRTGTLADQKLRRFQEDFPRLSSVVDGTPTAIKAEEKFSYGPGPSLRPQNVTTWREGGGRGILQISPPASPSQPSTPSTGSVLENLESPAGNLQSPTPSTNANTNTGMSRDLRKSAAPADNHTYCGVEKITSPVDGPEPFHGTVSPVPIRPALVPGPNGFMAFPGPVMPMMIPPFRFGHGFGHPYPAAYVYPFMSRLPLMNPMNAGLHGPDSATVFQSLMDKTLPSSSDKVDADAEAFSRLTVSESGSDEIYSRSMKQARDQSFDQHLSRDGPHGHQSNSYVEAEEYSKEYKLNKMARSKSDDSEELVYTPKNKGQLAQRSISNPCDSEELEDDPLHHRRKQQSQLMSAAVERARKRREEEERQLKEKQMAAAREKLRQLEEKVGKKSVKESKENEIESSESEMSWQRDIDITVSDKMANHNNTKSTVFETDEDVKTSESESIFFGSAPLSGYPPTNEGFYVRHPYATLPEHLHRLPSPKSWSVTAGSARMPFPQFPVDPYLYWRHLMESSGGMHYYPNMRMPFNTNLPEVNSSLQDDKKSGSVHASPAFESSNNARKTDEEFIVRSQSMLDCKLEERTGPGNSLFDSHEWNAYWIQPSWMKDRSNGSKSAQVLMSTKQLFESFSEKRSHSAEEGASDASDVLNKSPVASREVKSDSKKQASVLSRYSQDLIGIGADASEQHLYYQPWWNYSPWNKSHDPDSYYMPMEKTLVDSALKSKTCDTPEKYSYPEGKNDRVDPLNRSTHGRDFDFVQSKSFAHKQPIQGKNEDRYHYGHARDVHNEDQSYSAIHQKIVSESCDSATVFGSVPQSNIMNVYDDGRLQSSIHSDRRDDFSRSHSTAANFASVSSSNKGNSVKSTDACSKDNRMNLKRIKTRQENFMEKSSGVSNKSSSAFKQSHDRFLSDCSGESFWGSAGKKDYGTSKDRSNGLSESLSVNKSAPQQSDAKTVLEADNENRWNRNSYYEYQGYY